MVPSPELRSHVPSGPRRSSHGGCPTCPRSFRAAPRDAGPRHLDKQRSPTVCDQRSTLLSQGSRSLVTGHPLWPNHGDTPSLSKADTPSTPALAGTELPKLGLQHWRVTSMEGLRRGGGGGMQAQAAPENRSPRLMETVHVGENPIRLARDSPPTKEGRRLLKLVCSSLQKTETGSAQWKDISEHAERMVASA